MAKPSVKQKGNKSNVFVRAINKFSNLHKPAQIMIFALLFGLIGGGGYAVYSSFAATSLDSTNCVRLGRNWNGSSCSNSCMSGAGSYVIATPYSYCSGAVSKNIDKTSCYNLGRIYMNNGCLRRWDQKSTTDNLRCDKTRDLTWYSVQDPYDKCTAGRQAILYTMYDDNYVKISGCYNTALSGLTLRHTKKINQDDYFAISTTNSTTLDVRYGSNLDDLSGGNISFNNAVGKNYYVYRMSTASSAGVGYRKIGMIPAEAFNSARNTKCY